MNKIINSILGYIVGDALGVPYKCKERNTFKCNGMSASNGSSYYGILPVGAWSNHTSNILCLMDALELNNPVSQLERYKANYNNFKYNGLYTSTGIPLNTDDEYYSNVNNKILSTTFMLSFRSYTGIGEILDNIKSFNEGIYNINTENERQNIIYYDNYIGALIYILMVRALMIYPDIRIALQRVVNIVDNRYKSEQYKDIWNLDILNKKENDIKSDTSIADILDSVIYCMNTNSDYENTITSAVNLGENTDTIAALAGGLAGIIYKIPLKYKIKVKKYVSIFFMAEKECLNKQLM